MKGRVKCKTCGCLLIKRRPWRQKLGIGLIMLVLGLFAYRYTVDVYLSPGLG